MAWSMKATLTQRMEVGLELDLGLGRLFEVVARFVRGQTLTGAERKLVSVFEQDGAALGARLLESEDQADLSKRIDSAVRCPEVHGTVQQLLSAFIAAVPGDGLRRTMTAAYSPDFVGGLQAIVGERFHREADEIARLMAVYLRLAAPALAQSAPQPETLESELRQLAEQLDDPDLPKPLKDAGTAHLRVLLVQFALIQRALGQHVDPWLTRALVCELRDAVRTSLALLVATTGGEVSEDLLAPSQRLDLEALELEYRRNRTQRALRLVQQWQHEADEEDEWVRDQLEADAADLPMRL